MSPSFLPSFPLKIESYIQRLKDTFTFILLLVVSLIKQKLVKYTDIIEESKRNERNAILAT